METENKTYTEYIVDALRTAAIEMEELQVQAALGKAEAKDKYEEMKKKFSHFIHETKVKMESGKDKVDQIREKIDELRVQLALGKAETLEEFQAQKKKIMTVIHEIEVKIKTNENFNHYYSLLLIQIEKFKVQMEWLESKFQKGKEAVADSFENRKADFNSFINRMKEKLSKEEEPEKTKWENFQDEVSEAFKHMKKAFVQA